MKNFSEDYWSKRARLYNKTNWVKNEVLIDAFINMIAKESFSKILEVGIGTGAVAKIMIERKGSLIGIDIRHFMVNGKK